MRTYPAAMGDNGIFVRGPLGCLCCLLVVAAIVAVAYSIGKRNRGQ